MTSRTMSGNVTNSVARIMPGNAYTILKPISSKNAPSDGLGPSSKHNHQAADDRRYRKRQIDDAVQQALDTPAQPVRPYQIKGQHDPKQGVDAS